MKALPQISEAEYEVMRIIWKYAPVSTNEIVEKLTLTTRWNPRTIQTLIKRLVTKHAVTYEKQSRMFVYSPLVEEAEYVNQESASFLKKYYDGNISTMLSSYLENDRLTDAEMTCAHFLQRKQNRSVRNDCFQHPFFLLQSFDQHSHRRCPADQKDSR